MENEQFFSIIPSIYISSKDKPIFVYLNINELNISLFINKILSKVPKHLFYKVFIKVRYNLDSFFMAGSQFGFNFHSDLEIEDFFSIVMSRIKEYFDIYNLSEHDIVYIQISFSQKNKKLLSEFSLEKPFYITRHENLWTENKLSIPVSINQDSIGKPLPTIISNGIITHINLSINGVLLKAKPNY